MSSNEPEVGIFWTYYKKMFHVESSPISAATKTKISYDYPVGHSAAWVIMQRNGILDQLPPHLRDEYDAIPRGRVVFLLEKKSFVIYHGDDFNSEIFNELVKRLNLQSQKILDEIDEHYNPLPEDFLF